MSPLGRGTASWVIAASLLWAFGPARAETTAYDAQGRVISVVTDDGKQTKYIYDAAGNRTQVTASSTSVTLPPVAVDDLANYSYGGTAPVLHPLTNDSDPNGLALTIVGISPPQFGTATFTASTVSYTPPVAHVGAIDAFAYTIQNSAGGTASAVIQVTLKNPAPIANPVYETTSQGIPVTFNAGANDSDPGGLTFYVTAVGTPAHGTASFTPNTTNVTYTPSSGYWGSDSFSYTITNTAPVSKSSTVYMTVTAAPPAVSPYALNVSMNTPGTFDPRTVDLDPNYLPLTITAIGAPSHGTAVNNGGISVTYTPTTGYIGSDSFSYTVANTGGGSASSTVNASVTNGPLAASISSTVWNWTKYGSNPAHSSAAVLVTASGGQSPYSYAWQYVSGDTVITTGAPTSSSTTWTRSMTTYSTYSAVWRCKVTDNLGAVVYGGNVTVTFNWQDNQ